jgi:hypothetical protein
MIYTDLIHEIVMNDYCHSKSVIIIGSMTEAMCLPSACGVDLVIALETLEQF